MKALVTGAGGFVGKYLMAALEGSDYTAVGTTKGVAGDHQITLDLLDPAAVESALDRERPDIIFHLAAFSSPSESFKHPAGAISDTETMQINLYEACIRLRLTPRFMIISSGQIYGRAATAGPLDEQAAIDFVSPYSIAKYTQELIAHMYGKQGFESIIARPFNHIGPAQKLGFLVPDLANQIVGIERSGKPGTLLVGNLSSRRDFTDVRDIVQAYLLLAKTGVPGEIYNICSGRPVAGEDVLHALLAHSKAKIDVRPDPTRMRPADIPELYGDATKLRAQTGWESKIPLDQSLSEILDFWRQEAA